MHNYNNIKQCNTPPSYDLLQCPVYMLTFLSVTSDVDFSVLLIFVQRPTMLVQRNWYLCYRLRMNSQE